MIWQPPNGLMAGSMDCTQVAKSAHSSNVGLRTGASGQKCSDLLSSRFHFHPSMRRSFSAAIFAVAAAVSLRHRRCRRADFVNR
jgi:hypothetical protein